MRSLFFVILLFPMFSLGYSLECQSEEEPEKAMEIHPVEQQPPKYKVLLFNGTEQSSELDCNKHSANPDVVLHLRCEVVTPNTLFLIQIHVRQGKEKSSTQLSVYNKKGELLIAPPGENYTCSAM
jgi:hypothetical protein